MKGGARNAASARPQQQRTRPQLNPAFRKAAAQAAVQADAPGPQSLRSALARARKTGVLSLASTNLQEVPPQVFDGSELEPDEKFWECVELHKLDLSHNDIYHLPPGWGAITGLSTIIIRGNKLGGARLPADLFALPSLTSLDLSNNQLESSSIGEDLGGLRGSLLSLNLSGNRLVRLPESTAQLVRLESLDIQGNALEALPKQLGALSRLMRLAAADNSIAQLPPNFNALTQLQLLDLRKNRLEDVGTALVALSALTLVDLRENRLKVWPRLPGGSAQLAQLLLGLNQIADIDGESLLTLGQCLVELHLQNNSITRLPDEIGALQNLKTLDLSCNCLRELPAAIGYMCSLNRLLLEGNPLRSVRQLLVTGPTSELKKYLRTRGPPPVCCGPAAAQFTDADAYLPSQGLSHHNGTDAESGSSAQPSAALVAVLRDAQTTGTLALSGQGLMRIPPEVFADPRVCEAITKAELSGNALAHLPRELASFTRLKALEADGNKLCDLPQELGQLAGLTRVSLARNCMCQDGLNGPLNGRFAAPLAACLHDLNLQANQLENVPEALFQCSALRTLCLSMNALSDVSRLPWTALTALETLDLSDNRITALGDITVMTWLRHLNVANNALMGIPPGLGLCTGLQSLQITGNPQRALRASTVDKGISHVLQYLRDRLPPGTSQPPPPTVHPPPPRPPPPTASNQCLNHNPQHAPTHSGATGTRSATPPPQHNGTTISGMSDAEWTALCSEIGVLEDRMEAPGLSQAQLYAIKKQLQMKRAARIKAERSRGR